MSFWYPASQSGIVFYFLSGRAWLITDNSFTGRVTCSSEQGHIYHPPSQQGPVSSHGRMLLLRTSGLFLPSLLGHIQWDGVTWSHITLCKCNCWRDDRRDFTSPLNTNLIFQPSLAQHCSQPSLSLIVWTKSMNSRILCVYDLREERGL